MIAGCKNASPSAVISSCTGSPEAVVEKGWPSAIGASPALVSAGEPHATSPPATLETMIANDTPEDQIEFWDIEPVAATDAPRWPASRAHAIAAIATDRR